MTQVTQLLGEREGKMKGEVDVSTEYRSNAVNHTQSFTGRKASLSGKETRAQCRVCHITGVLWHVTEKGC